MEKRTFICVILSIAWLLFSATPLFSETFEEYRERTRREQEEQNGRRQEQNSQDDDEEDDGNFCEGIFGCLRLFSMLGDSSDNEDDRQNDRQSERQGGPEPAPSTCGCAFLSDADPFRFELSGDFGHLFGQEYKIWSAGSFLDLNFYFLDFNVIYDVIMAEDQDPIHIISINAGALIALEGFRFSVFCGALFEPSIPYAFFSFGANMKAVVAKPLLLNLFVVASIDGTLEYILVDVSFDYMITDNFTAGIGVKIIDCNSLFMAGPKLRVAVVF